MGWRAQPAIHRAPPVWRAAAAAPGEVVQREPVRSTGPCDTVAAGLQPVRTGPRHYSQSDETSTKLTLYRLRYSA